jgi:hypothetical protein
MLVQYLVGLLCVKANPDSIEITLGDQVVDPTIDKKRDVDVTVTATLSGRQYAFKAYEVKAEKTPLDVTVIEQLCQKLNDLGAFSHKGIVSSSGYSESATRKAVAHGVKLYSLQSWDTPVEADFPRLGLRGTPTNVLQFTRRLLMWNHDAYLHFHCPDAAEPFTVSDGDPIFTPSGKVHKFATVSKYRQELLLRSTEILSTIAPIIDMAGIESHTHTISIERDAACLMLSGKLCEISTVTILGFLGWVIDRKKIGYRIMRELETNSPFGAAAIPTVRATVCPSAPADSPDTLCRRSRPHMRRWYRAGGRPGALPSGRPPASRTIPGRSW